MILETDSVGEMSSKASFIGFGESTEIKPMPEIVIEDPYAEN